VPTSPTRRLVLAALAATAVAGTSGCSTPWGDLRVQPLGGDPPPPVPEPGPDELARRSAVGAVSAVLAALDASALDAAVAGPLRAALGEQLAALGESAPSSTPSSTPGSTPSSPPSGPSPGTAAGSPAGGAVAPVVGLMTSAAAAAREPLADVAGGTARLLACLAAGLDVAAGWASGGPAGGPSSTGGPTSGGPSSAGPASPAPTRASARPSSTASPSRTPADGAGEQGALVVALAAEEAAEYGYGVLAVRLAGEQRSRAQADLAAHALAVEELREQLLALGADPPGSPPAWALPGPVPDAAGAVALAVRLEAAATAAAADVVAAADRGRRAADAERVLTAAQRWQWWRSQQPQAAPALVALPGLSGR